MYLSILLFQGKRFIFLYVSIVLLMMSCNTNSEERFSKAQQKTVEYELLSKYLTPSETKHLLAIKAIFDDALCFQGTIEQASDCYLAHAQVYSYDMVKQISQMNENYPYNTKFDLSKAKNHTDSLSFLTLNCGFQVEATEEIIHYYCLKDKGKFMEYLGELGKTNALIEAYRNDYVEKKQVRDKVKKRIGSTAQFELDFKQVDHQIFYMFYHLMINEKVKAQKKIPIG